MQIYARPVQSMTEVYRPGRASLSAADSRHRTIFILCYITSSEQAMQGIDAGVAFTQCHLNLQR